MRQKKGSLKKILYIFNKKFKRVRTWNDFGFLEGQAGRESFRIVFLFLTSGFVVFICL